MVGGLSCASLLKGPKSTLELNSIPHDSRILLNGTYYGKTPMSVAVPSDKNYLIEAEKAGYETKVSRINRTYNWSWLFFDLVPLVSLAFAPPYFALTSLVAIAGDYLTGSAYDLDQDSLDMILEKRTKKQQLIFDMDFQYDDFAAQYFVQKNKNKISILSYNLQLMPKVVNLVKSMNKPFIRASEIPKLVSNFDVVVFQEVFDTDLALQLKKEMKRYYPYSSSLKSRNQKVKKKWFNFLGIYFQRKYESTSGNLVFSKWPILKEVHEVFKESRKSDGLAAKSLIYTKIAKDNKNYHLITTHLQAWDYKGAKFARKKQLDQIKHFIERRTFPVDEPVILAGDLNLDHSSDEFNIFVDELKIDVPTKKGLPYSFDPITNSMAEGDKREHIDHILSLSAYAKAKVSFNYIYPLRTTTPGMLADLSDHYPVLGYFEF